MKKPKHTALAALGAATLISIAGPALAQSNNQFYGVLDVWAGTSKTSGGGASSSVLNSGGMTTSYWGFAGQEELGGTLRALYTIQGYLAVDTGTSGRSPVDAMFSRQVYVGLTDSWGELKLGRVANQLFFSNALSNPFLGSTRFSPMMVHAWVPQYGRSVAGDTSWDNAISYTTPLINEFKATVQLGLGETTFGTGTNNFGVNVAYSSGPLYATAHAQQTKVGPGLATIGTSAQRTYFLGGAYDLKLAKLYASYTKSNNEGPESSARTAQLGISVPASTGRIQLSWARTKLDTPNSSVDRDGIALGYDYDLSKRTDIYVAALYDKLSTANGATSAGIGIRHKF